MKPELMKELAALCPGRILEDPSLRDWTTFRCSAHVAAIATPAGAEELAALIRWFARRHLERGKDWAVIGRGSNLLVLDGGFPGVLIDLSAGFSKIQMVKEEEKRVRVRAGAGVLNSTLLQWARERNLTGFGWAFGIPGTIGGGVRMNAGTPLGWYGQLVERVEGVDRDGGSVSIATGPADFRYRDFPKGDSLVITAAHLTLQRGTPNEVETEIGAAKEKRKNQPLDLPNFGSVFKNPPGDHAGRLIEAAGLKGLRIGGAEISKQHANFIVNLGNAKSADVLALMARARDEVRKRFNVDLEAEVHWIGVES
ncbi:MAG: UDP-N-acetylmuramate dehydrogenase [Pseudomonadota bacterium]